MTDRRPVFTYRIAVRFRDCDMQGHVNNAVYLTYLEQARVVWWRDIGGERQFSGLSTVVVRAELDYRAAALLHDELDVQIYLESVGRSSITVSYRVLNSATEHVVLEAKTVSVTIDLATGKPVPVPEPAKRLMGFP